MLVAGFIRFTHSIVHCRTLISTTLISHCRKCVAPVVGDWCPSRRRRMHSWALAGVWTRTGTAMGNVYPPFGEIRLFGGRSSHCAINSKIVSLSIGTTTTRMGTRGSARRQRSKLSQHHTIGRNGPLVAKTNVSQTSLAAVFLILDRVCRLRECVGERCPPPRPTLRQLRTARPKPVHLRTVQPPQLR